MALSYVLFDLDGTLTDPAEGITNCVRYALEKFNIHPQTREELYPYIGPPLIVSFMDFHGLSQPEAEQAVAFYRERFSVEGLFENELFDGIVGLLENLRQNGVELMVATSKPEEFTHRILEHFDLAKYFTFVAGSTLAGERPEKADVIAYIRQNFPQISADNTVMVGDRKFDVEGAHLQGLPVIGVLYGYGDQAEMETAKAEYIIEDIPHLQKLLMEML